MVAACACPFGGLRNSPCRQHILSRYTACNSQQVQTTWSGKASVQLACPQLPVAQAALPSHGWIPRKQFFLYRQFCKCSQRSRLAPHVALGKAKHSSTKYSMLPHGFEHPPDKAACPVPIFSEVLKSTSSAYRLHCDSPSRGCYSSKLGQDTGAARLHHSRPARAAALLSGCDEALPAVS